MIGQECLLTQTPLRFNSTAAGGRSLELPALPDSIKMGSVKNKYIFGVIILMISLGFNNGCRRPTTPGAGVIHLIDKLEAAGVRESPLQNLGPEALTESVYPVESNPLDNIPANPLGLKRRHYLGSVENRILFAPSRSVYRIPIVLPDQPVLEIGFGIVRDHHAEKFGAGERESAKGAEFRVMIEIEGRDKPVFQRHLEMPPLRESRTVNYAKEKISLPGGGRKAVLTLITGGDGRSFSFWHEPVIFGASDRLHPNVIIVSLDTLRADHLGVYGYSRPTSPNIDALAKDSALFENAYATSPWTLPSHVSMLSGLNCVRHRVYYENDRIDPKTPWLSTILRNHGYACAALTGGGYVSSFYGFSRGFGSYSMSQNEIGSEVNADEAAKQSLDWLEANADRPFFLFVHTYQMHIPYGPREPYKKMFLDPDAALFIWDWKGATHIYEPLSESVKRNIVGLYDGCIRLTDEALIKALIDRLKSLGIYDRTLLIVTSDHGEEFFDHGGWTHTRTVYDEVIKVPLVIHFPGGRYAGRRLNPLVRLVDIVPTVLEELGIGFEADSIDGRSLQPILDGRETADRHFVAELAANASLAHNHATIAVNNGRTKLILNGLLSPEDFSYFAYPPPIIPLLELFDLKSDPGEKKNIADRPEQAATARALAEKAEALMRSLKGRPGEKRILPKDLENQLRALGYIK